MRYILATLLLASMALAINWTPAPDLRAAEQQAAAEFWEDWQLAVADSIEIQGVMFEMPAAVRSYYRSEAIASWTEWQAAIDAFEAHATQ
jgi:hypothetical protein